MNNLENKRQKEKRERDVNAAGPHFRNLKSAFQKGIRPDYHTELMRQHLLFTRSEDRCALYSSIWSTGTKHSFPSLFLSISLCVCGRWGSVAVTEFEWTVFIKGLFYHMIPLINRFVLQHKKKAHAVWILMLTLSKWLALRLQNNTAV